MTLKKAVDYHFKTEETVTRTKEGWEEITGERRPVFHLSMSSITVNCPHCGKKYIDDDETILNKINKNKSGITMIKCECGKRFYVTADYSGLVAFE